MDLKNYESLFAALFGITASFLFWAITPNLLLPSWITIICLIVVMSLIWYIVVLKEEYKRNLEKLNVITPQIKVISFVDNDLCLTCNVQNLIVIGSILTIFYKENGFEKVYGIAKLNNIQTNGILQAEIINDINLGYRPHQADLIVKANLTESFFRYLNRANR